jgi:multiple sugar transport system permease protein
LAQTPAITAAATTKPAQTKRFGRGWRTDLVAFGFALPFMIAYAIFVIWPIITGLQMSFTDASLLGGASNFVGLDNYRGLMKDSNFWDALWNTAKFALYTTPLLAALGLAFALLANRQVPARWLFRLAFFAPYLLPVSVMSLIWIWLYQPGFGLINSWLTTLHLGSTDWLHDQNAAMFAVALATIWWTLGFNFILYLAGLQEIPTEIYEAAAIDGAGAWARLWRITIPLLSRTTALIVILQVLASLKVFSQIYIMTGGGPNNATRPVVQYIYETAFQNNQVGYASAMSDIFFLVLLVVALVQFFVLTRQDRGTA